MNNKHVVIIGLGYVGLPLALLAAKKEYTVTGIDMDTTKVEKINNKISPIKDEEVQSNLNSYTITATTSTDEIKQASIIIICVPTPVYANHMPNLEPVESACRQIGQKLQRGQLVILESTVNPGVCEEIVIPILEKESGLKVGADFHIAHCPERIDPGNKKWNVENINRVVGGYNAESTQKAAQFYHSIITGEVREMGSLKEAEAVKVVENSFRDINIAFVNELAQSFHEMGINVVNVINGAATKPFAFMPHYPGCGVGGHCIPVDPYYLIEEAKKKGFEHDFLRLARRINSNMPRYTVEMLKDGLNSLKKSVAATKIAILGVSYKANIDDCRESPSFEIIRLIQELGADITIFDPFVPKHSTVKTLDEALQDAEAIVLTTAHTEFKNIDIPKLSSKGIKLIIDGRNCLDQSQCQEVGIQYRGIGC
ncbi:MAG: nucleotide sugar dehydrogenase [bacterium]|nr:nucleotide sugar dehydrogenase [bacterium]